MILVVWVMNTQGLNEMNTEHFAQMQATAQHELDTSGLLCPEPVMLLHNVVRDAANAEKILVVATDPSTQRDIPKFCQFLGHRLLEQGEIKGKYMYLIEKVG